MENATWKIIKETFGEVFELSDEERTLRLADADPEVRLHVEKLLAANDSSEDFIKQPFAVERGMADGHDDQVIGTDIDEYHILSEIGSGGMGKVYLAEHAGDGFSQRVALKLIKRGMDTNVVLKRFLMERQILARLEHPNIARMLDGGSTESGLPYFVMEYVNGAPIRRYCEEHDLGISERLELFQKVCSAVSYAHQNLVVHRDLKPSNILINKEGQPKLLDFGIAKLLGPDWGESTAEATATQFRVMTPEYASPEQIEGKPATTTTDVYSLGVVLYELLAGTRPFTPESREPSDVAKAVLSGEPPKPSAAVSRRTSDNAGSTAGPESGNSSRPVDPKSLAGDLDNIVLKALRREPERRYQSVQEFSEDIRRYLVGLPVTATADSRLYRFNKYFKRNRAGVIGTAVAAVILLSATAITGWQYTLANRERDRAEQRFNDTRVLARSMIYELFDAIDAVPESTKAKELLAAKAVEYLDRLAAEGSDDPYLLTELADGYQRIGDIQGGFGRANLGQTEEAGKSYEKARALRERVVATGAPEPKFRMKLAAAYSKAAETEMNSGNIPGMKDYYYKALETLQNLQTEMSADDFYLFELSAAYGNAGRADAITGSFEEGIAKIKTGIDMVGEVARRRPDEPRFMIDYSSMHDFLAEIYSGQGEDKEAFEYSKRSYDILTALSAGNPGDSMIERNLAVTSLNMAAQACDIGNFDEALKSAEMALSVSSRRLAAEPENADNHLLHGASLLQKGRILARTGNPFDAIALLETARGRADKLLELDPSNKVTVFQAAIVDRELGFALMTAGLSKPIGQERTQLIQRARAALQKAFDVHKSYRDEGITTGKDAAATDEIAENIAKCDAALK